MNRSIAYFGLVLLLGFCACRTQRKTTVAPRSVPTSPPPVVQTTKTNVVERAPVAPAPVEPKLPVPTESKLKLPAIFSHNMVLQQGMSVPIWGWANEGE